MFRGNNKKISFMLIITMLFLFSAASMQNLTYADEQIESRIEELIDKTIDYYKNNKTELTTWDEIVALESVGEDITQQPWQLPKWESDDLDGESSAIVYASYILGMMAKGEDPTDIWGRNLVAELIERQKSNGAFDIVNEHIWAVIALDAADADYDREEAIKYLISQQKNDGGYAYGEDDTPEEPSEPDMTGMALVALSRHRDVEGVDATIEKILDYIEGIQLPTGGFESWGNENANSIAAIITGLVAIEEDVMSERWVKDDGTMLDALEKFMLEDGSFTYVIDPKESNDIATCQALIALNDLKEGETVWNTLTIEPKGIEEDDKDEEVADEDVQTSDAGKKSTKIILAVLVVAVAIYLIFNRMRAQR